MNKAISLFITIAFIMMSWTCFSLNNLDNIVKSYPKLEDKIPVSPDKNRGISTDPLSYIPDSLNIDHTPIRYVRVNFHFVNNSDGSSGLSRDIARKLVYQTLDSANQSILAKNIRMRLPKYNNFTVLPPLYRYVLTGDGPNDEGIYFHTDDEMAYINTAKNSRGKSNNLFSKDIYKKYGIQKEEVINVFMVNHHPDSLKVKTYKKTDGVGYPDFVKLTKSKSRYEKYVENAKAEKKDMAEALSRTALYFAKYLVHEIGHSLGLAHTWNSNDGCDDTPRHSNCWYYNKKNPNCDRWHKVSNNIMDYNATMRAHSSCQIGKVHSRFAKEGSPQRKKLIPVWCKYDKNFNVEVENDVVWEGAKDLQGDIIIKNNSSLTINCLVSLPQNAKIIVYPKGKLIVGKNGLVSNRCGDKWAGIEVWENEKFKGEIQIAPGGLANVNFQNTPNPTGSSNTKAKESAPAKLKPNTKKKAKAKTKLKR